MTFLLGFTVYVLLSASGIGFFHTLAHSTNKKHILACDVFFILCVGVFGFRKQHLLHHRTHGAEYKNVLSEDKHFIRFFVSQTSWQEAVYLAINPGALFMRTVLEFGNWVQHPQSGVDNIIGFPDSPTSKILFGALQHRHHHENPRLHHTKLERRETLIYSVTTWRLFLRYFLFGQHPTKFLQEA